MHPEHLPAVCTPVGSHNNLFQQEEGSPSDYALLLFIMLVPLAHLQLWMGTLSYDGVGGKPGIPQNLTRCLESYLSQMYMYLPPATEDKITSGIDTFLGV